MKRLVLLSGVSLTLACARVGDPLPDDEAGVPAGPQKKDGRRHGFVPTFVDGHTWHVDGYDWFSDEAGRAMAGHRTDPPAPDDPPCCRQPSPISAISAMDAQGGINITFATRRARMSQMHDRMYVRADGCLVEWRESGHSADTDIPPCEPYLNSGQGGGSLPVWWPSFPLVVGEMQTWAGGAKTQQVTLEGDVYEIVMQQRLYPEAAYPVRTVKMTWARDKPWWSSVELKDVLDENGRGLDHFEFEGHVDRWYAPEMLPGPRLPGERELPIGSEEPDVEDP